MEFETSKENMCFMQLVIYYFLHCQGVFMNKIQLLSSRSSIHLNWRCLYRFNKDNALTSRNPMVFLVCIKSWVSTLKTIVFCAYGIIWWF